MSNSAENQSKNQSLTFTEEGQPQQGQQVPPNNEAKIKEPVDLSQQRKQQVADAFDEICITAGRKDEQTFNLENDDGTVTKKKFIYHAAKSGERYKITKIEERRAMAVRSVVEFAALKKRSKGDEKIELFSTVDHELNYTMANIFLRDPDTKKGMTQEEYESIPFSEINPVLQGYALRTERPLPPPLGTKTKDVIT